MQRFFVPDRAPLYRLFLLIAACCFTGAANATEVRGKVLAESGQGAAGATVQVSCGTSFKAQAAISASGAYSLGNVPDNRACEVSVLRGSARLGRSSFESSPGVMRFDWRIKRYGERLFAVLE